MYQYLKKYTNLWVKLLPLIGIAFQLILIPQAYAKNKMLEIDIHIKNHVFEPDVIDVPSGTKLRVTIHNMDSTIEEFDSADLKREKIIPGKTKARIILAPLKVGEYHFIGEFHEETAKGKFVVTELEPVDKENIEGN